MTWVLVALTLWAAWGVTRWRQSGSRYYQGFGKAFGIPETYAQKCFLLTSIIAVVGLSAMLVGALTDTQADRTESQPGVSSTSEILGTVGVASVAIFTLGWLPRDTRFRSALAATMGPGAAKAFVVVGLILAIVVVGLALARLVGLAS